MAPMPRVFCAGSRKRLSSRSCFRFRDRQESKDKNAMANNSNLRVAIIGGGAGGDAAALLAARPGITVHPVHPEQSHGGGPGVYAAAFLAADLGIKVTLIDPEVNPGGVCLYRGCIPSKALLHVAKLIEESQQAKNWGIEFPPAKIDLAGLRTWKEGVVKRLTGGLGQLSK